MSFPSLEASPWPSGHQSQAHPLARIISSAEACTNPPGSRHSHPFLPTDSAEEPRFLIRIEDGVAVATSQIDFHSLTKQGHSGFRERVYPYSIPLRALTARGFKNLLMAGKCMSADQIVHASCRMTPNCCATGQAAGTAAAMAVESGCGDIREVPVAKLRSVLAGDGMELDPAGHKAFCTEVSKLDGDDIAP
jgi:hypothetical protein